MLRYVGLLLLSMLLFIACRERANQFDPGSEDFTTPPPFWYAAPIGGWYSQQGYLVGVRIEANFSDEFTRSLDIMNILYQGETELARGGISVPRGAYSYEIDLMSSSAMDLGWYCTKLYFGEIAIGSCQFEVVEDTSGLFIRGITKYDTVTSKN